MHLDRQRLQAQEGFRDQGEHLIPLREILVHPKILRNTDGQMRDRTDLPALQTPREVGEAAQLPRPEPVLGIRQDACLVVDLATGEQKVEIRTAGQGAWTWKMF